MHRLLPANYCNSFFLNCTVFRRTVGIDNESQALSSPRSSARHSQVGASKAISDCRCIAMLLNRERRAAEQPSSRRAHSSHHGQQRDAAGQAARPFLKSLTIGVSQANYLLEDSIQIRKKPNSSRNLPNHWRSALYYAGTEKAVPAVRLSSIGSVFGHLLLQDSQIGDDRRRFILQNIRRVLAAILDCEVRTQASLV